jgi:perosamine synthetase
MKHLSDSGIMTHIYFPPVHLTQFYRREFGYREGNLPITEKVASEVLTLPMYPTLTKEETDYIGAQISNFFA